MSGTHYLHTATGRALPPPPRNTPHRHSSVLRLPTHRFDPALDAGARPRVDNPLVEDNTNYIAPEQVPNSRVVPYRRKEVQKGTPASRTATTTSRTATNSRRPARRSSTSSSSSVNSGTSDASSDSPRLGREEGSSRVSSKLVKVALSDQSSSRYVDARAKAPLTREQIVSSYVNDRCKSWEQQTPPTSAKNYSQDGEVKRPRAVKTSTTPKEKEVEKEKKQVNKNGVADTVPPAQKDSRPVQPQGVHKLSITATSERGASAFLPFTPTVGQPFVSPVKNNHASATSPNHHHLSQQQLQVLRHEEEPNGSHDNDSSAYLSSQQQQQQQKQKQHALSPAAESPSASVVRALSRSPSSPRVNHRPPPPKVSTYQPQVSSRAERGQPSPPSPRYSASPRNDEPMEQRVRRYSRSPPRSVKHLGGTELLPRRPLLQGMQYDDDRYYRTIIRFIEGQPKRQQPELRAMLAEYEGREDELCDALTEAYGDDFDVMKSSLPQQRVQDRIAAPKGPQQALLMDHSSQQQSSKTGKAAGPPSCDPHARPVRELDLDDDDSGYVAADMLTPPVPTKL